MKNILTILAILAVVYVQAQELQATVSVLSPNVQNTNKQVFSSLETAMREFLNTTQWTNEAYKQEERIECSFVFNITEQVSLNQFKSTLQVQFSRPTHKSGYKSPVLNLLDRTVNFNYLEQDRLEFIENTHVSNLTSVLAFYVYVIIGMDHDTYELESGDPYYVLAQNIVNNAQADPLGAGWRNFDGNNNRYWLIDNMMNPAFKSFRTCLYEYHRNGLDLMQDKSRQKEAKLNIAKAVENLKEVHQKRPNSYLSDIFFDSKSQEIVQIFSGGERIDLKAMVNTLNLMDPNNGDAYGNMGKNLQ